MALVIRTKQNVTLDQVCALAYGDPRSSMLVAVMKVNPHLRDYPELLPAGVNILLPDLDQPAVPAARVRLWDESLA